MAELKPVEKKLTSIERFNVIRKLVDHYDNLEKLIALRKNNSNDPNGLPNSGNARPNDLEDANKLAEQIDAVVTLISTPKVGANQVQQQEQETQNSNGPTR